MLSKRVVTKELSKEKEDKALKYTKEKIQKTISNYKNLYNSAYNYSNDNINKFIDKYALKEQDITSPQTSLKWIKTDVDGYHSAQYFGSEKDESKRVYLLTLHYNTEVIVYDSKTKNGKQLAYFSKYDIPLMKPRIEKQFENLLRGEKLIY